MAQENVLEPVSVAEVESVDTTKNQVADVVELEKILQGAEYDPLHCWLLSNKEVAAGFGVAESHIRTTKHNKSDELIKDVHWISIPQENGGSDKTYWTKTGVIYLGFFLRGKRAIAFRTAAAKYLADGTPGGYGMPFGGTYAAQPHESEPSEAVGKTQVQDQEQSGGVDPVNTGFTQLDGGEHGETLIDPYLEQIAGAIAPDATMKLLTHHVPNQIVQNIYRIYSGGATEAEKEMLERAYRPIASLIVFEQFVSTLKETLSESRLRLQQQGVIK